MYFLVRPSIASHGVEHQDIKLVVCAYAELVALILCHVYGTPAGGEAWILNRRVAIEAEAGLTQRWHAANPSESLGAGSSTIPFAEIAYFIAYGAISRVFHIQGIPVTDRRTLQNRSVKAIFCISVFTSSSG